jgi:outer membrane protein
MNTIKRSFFLVLTSLLLFGTAGLAAAQTTAMQTAPASGTSPATVGLVDFIYLINQHPDTAKANELLKTEQDKAHQEYVAKSAGMSEADQKELDRQLGAQVEQKRQELLKPITAQINAAIKAVADAKGVSIVLPKGEAIYGGLDLTDDVLMMIKGQ